MKIFKVPGLTLAELEQMLGEAVLLSKLNHPNIIRTFNANVLEFNRQHFGFFTMEYVAGGRCPRSDAEGSAIRACDTSS
jgi:eukaryotic-like serine/threonine-protein kinase